MKHDDQAPHQLAVAATLRSGRVMSHSAKIISPIWITKERQEQEDGVAWPLSMRPTIGGGGPVRIAPTASAAMHRSALGGRGPC